MRIVLCGSMSFIDQMRSIAKKIESFGHEVVLPKEETKGNTKTKITDKAKTKIAGDYIRHHFLEIAKADAILVMNFEKNNIRGYIGGNTFMEMGFAHALSKDIILYNSIPKMSYTDEIIAMKPSVIRGRLNKLEKYNLDSLHNPETLNREDLIKSVSECLREKEVCLQKISSALSESLDAIPKKATLLQKICPHRQKMSGNSCGPDECCYCLACGKEFFYP